MKFKRKRPDLRIHDCSFNSGCACEKMICSKCGWNPAVEAERAEQIRKRMEAEARHG